MAKRWHSGISPHHRWHVQGNSTCRHNPNDWAYCADSTLWLYINETLIRKVDVSSYDLTAGKAGLAASSFENIPIVIGFDSVTFSEP